MTTKVKFNKKDYMATYNKSTVAKQAQKNWFQSPEGKAKHRAAQKNYHFKYCGIYGAKDLQTGDYLYIGASKSINGRINNHRYATRNLAQAQKCRPTQYELYVNLSQHQVEWVIICQCDQNKLKSLEKHYITMYQPPYNKNSKKTK
jgi:excinuclease UvrABC nuclease subunit